MVFVKLERSKAPIFVLLTLTLNVSGALGESDYQWLARARHNRYRARHNAKPLNSSNDLHKKAEKCAQYYIDRGNIDHTCPYARRFGENIWANWGGTLSASRVISRSLDGWYNEEALYKYNDSQRGTGHYTQMVWKGSKSFGYGIARSRKGKMTVAVALYDPPGNYIGEYAKNVERPQSRTYYKTTN